MRGLVAGCERVEVGYVVRREVYSAEFSQGVENIVADSQAGFNAPVFIRTVKLKDFPWNGWLRVGVAGKPAAAWNPIGGFSDPAGRLLWATVGDPASFPMPGNSEWLANRVTAAPGPAGPVSTAVPEDALMPDPSTGQAREVGKGKRPPSRRPIAWRPRRSTTARG